MRVKKRESKKAYLLSELAVLILEPRLPGTLELAHDLARRELRLGRHLDVRGVHRARRPWRRAAGARAGSGAADGAEADAAGGGGCSGLCWPYAREKASGHG